MQKNVVETNVNKIFLGNDGIVRIIHFAGIELTIEDANQTMAVVLTITKGRRYPLLCDNRNLKSITREARQYYAGEEAEKVTNAVAILVESPRSRVLANFFLQLNKPDYPLRLFTSENKATEWLKEFKNDL